MLLLALQVNAQSSVTGNCYTQRIDMDPLRMYALPFSGVAPALDVSRYDVTVDYGSVNVKATNPYGTDITLAKASNSKFGDGARISTTRYILYGRLTARIKTSTVPGLVTTFITMSDRKDEIDWEIVGGDSTTAQSNIFYKGIAEYGLHGGKHSVGGSTEQWHTYTIDWKSTSITFSIDGRVVRTYLNDDKAVSPMTPRGEKWFPSTPSKVQISVWDGCKEGKQGTCNWAGGPVNYNQANAIKASFEYIDIACYDNQNRFVRKWPSTTENPDRKDALPSQPTAAGGQLANTGNPGGLSGFENSAPFLSSIWAFVFGFLYL